MAGIAKSTVEANSFFPTCTVVRQCGCANALEEISHAEKHDDKYDSEWSTTNQTRNTEVKR